MSVVARKRIVVSNDGRISINNRALVDDSSSIKPTTLRVSAPVIKLFGSGGEITAAAFGNVSASNIAIQVQRLLSLDDSTVQTSAQVGDGGSISIRGRGTVLLSDSQINTSVLGLTGDGGPISIQTRSLVMDTGSITANTRAADARGGEVTVGVQALVPSGNVLFVGGQSEIDATASNFNVIQAVAPTGVNGTITVSAPTFDLAGSLSGLEVQAIDTAGLARSLCETSGGSAFAHAGRGGLPPSARGLLGAASAPHLAAAELSAPVHLAATAAGCLP